MTLNRYLDRQVWHMLNGRLAHLAKGGEAVLRLDPRYGPFAALRDESDEAQGGVAALFEGPQDELYLVEPDAVAAPPGTTVLRTRALLQMVAEALPGEDERPDDEAILLGEEHAPAMAALAHATKPGPWAALTHRFGPFYGIVREGRLAAMAGQRMLPCAGVTEVSGVCTWPEFQGQGLGARLTRHVMANLRARGEQPYLHTYADNAVAIGLYRRLGFRERREMILTVLGKA